MGEPEIYDFDNWYANVGIGTLVLGKPMALTPFAPSAASIGWHARDSHVERLERDLQSANAHIEALQRDVLRLMSNPDPWFQRPTESIEGITWTQRWADERSRRMDAEHDGRKLASQLSALQRAAREYIRRVEFLIEQRALVFAPLDNLDVESGLREMGAALMDLLK